jgi:hypothetical protein
MLASLEKERTDKAKKALVIRFGNWKVSADLCYSGYFYDHVGNILLVIVIEGVPEPVGRAQGAGRSAVSPRQPGHQPKQGQKKNQFQLPVHPLSIKRN